MKANDWLWFLFLQEELECVSGAVAEEGVSEGGVLPFV
jgi:hypothetical protein